MKKITVAIIFAAISCFSAAGASAEVTDQDYTVYSFESDSLPTCNKTGGVKTELVPGALGSGGAMRITLSGTDGNRANGSVQMPVYLQKGIEYNISFYYKPESNGSITTIRPLIFDANKKYKFLDNITTANMTPLEDGWYYYKTTYTPDDVSGASTYTDGFGTFELRMVRGDDTDNSSYLLDDIIIEPANKTGYKNVLLDEDFNTGRMNTFTAYSANSRTTVKQKTEGDYYAEVTGTTKLTGIKSNNDNYFDMAEGKTYRMSFDVMGCDDKTNGAKIMWILKDTTYAVNVSQLTVIKDTWKSYTAEFTVKDNKSDQNISSRLGNSMGENGTYALDNIKLEEVMPQLDSVNVTGDLKPSAAVTANVSADTGITKYIYKVLTSSDQQNYTVVANGVSDSPEISYMVQDEDAGKYIKFEVTGCDDTHVYNTAECISETVVEGTQKTSMSFIGGIGTKVTAEFIEYEYDSAVAFVTLYDADGKLIGINSQTLQKGVKAELSAIASQAPAKAKIVMFDSIKTLNQILPEQSL